MRACLILILIPILVLGFANASKITVGPKDANYSHIQQAIDNSSQGDIIEVQSGVYRENVHVYKTLTLQGIDSGNGTSSCGCRWIGKRHKHNVQRHYC